MTTAQERVGVVEDVDRGPSIQVRSGGYFHITDPTPDEIDIYDIASALSKINRFTGHTTVPYSVAQHSCLVSDFLPRELKLAGLLHDSPEYAIGDISRPLKVLLDEQSQGFIRIIEGRIGQVIGDKFGVDSADFHRPAVKHADNVLLATEKRDLMHKGRENQWPGLPAPLKETIVPWDSERSAQEFLLRFQVLGGFR